MTLFNQTREINQQESTLINRMFKALVINNNDPLKIGRIKVRVNGIHDNLSDEMLPWSMSCTAQFGSGIGTNGLNIPEVGTYVWLLFCSNDLYSSLYFGGANQITSSVDNDLLEDYPNSYGWVDSSGNLFVVNKTKGYLKIQLISGATICWDNNGLSINTSNVGPGINNAGFNFNVIGPVNFNCSDSFNVNASSVNINASGNISINGSHVGLNDSGSGSSTTVTEPEKRVTPTIKNS